MTLRHLFRLLIASGLLAIIPSGTASATCVGLNCSCSVSADPLDFDIYNPLGGSHADAVGNVSVTCGALVLGANISYEVVLGAGGNGTGFNRAMSNGSDLLDYNLYTDSSRALIWGDGTGGTDTVMHAYLLSLVFSTTDDFPIYGRIPSGQNVETGSYGDTIVATVIF
ncbi:spore coat U domain-containing protein [uncultured Hyphomonas sp.]|uniref:Csu type fimbrial protein n=1 Tax=uncultured Hyphomonas sp. TaxID=225298 RepID=UPI002AAA6C68|nr:spore coat U domain-containing protein [uncultured Hyphomonas sp.]